MKYIGYAGFLMFLIGGAGMDSEVQIIPAVLALIGAAILYLDYRLEGRESECDE